MTDRPKKRVGALTYPLNQEDRYETKIKFQAVKIIPPTVNGLGVKQAFEGVVNRFTEGPPGNSGPRQQPASNLKFFNIDGEVTNLYVPLGGFQVNDGFDYASSSLGQLGAGAMAAINRGGSLVGAAFEGLSQFGQSAVDVGKAFVNSGELGRAAAVRAGQAIGPAGGLAVRATMNPNIRTNFNGVSVREFVFNFKFLPCSREESLAVKSIIQFFRFHAYPEEIASFGSFSVGFEYPNMFKIRLLAKGEDSRFKNIGTPIKLSYLKAVSTTYNATSPVLHEDGAPTEIDMNLTFVEYKAQTRTDIEDEDNDSFYHFENGQQTTEADYTRSIG